MKQDQDTLDIFSSSGFTKPNIRSHPTWSRYDDHQLVSKTERIHTERAIFFQHMTNSKHGQLVEEWHVLQTKTQTLIFVYSIKLICWSSYGVYEFFSLIL